MPKIHKYTYTFHEFTFETTGGGDGDLMKKADKGSGGEMTLWLCNNSTDDILVSIPQAPHGGFKKMVSANGRESVRLKLQRNYNISLTEGINMKNFPRVSR